MVDCSNAKILDLAVHMIRNKSKDEELVLTDAYISFFFTPFNNATGGVNFIYK